MPPPFPAIFAGAGDFDSDSSGVKTAGFGLFLEVVGGAGWHGELGYTSAIVADEMFGLLVVLARCGAQHESLLAGNVMDNAELLECGEGSVDTDDVNFCPF